MEDNDSEYGEVMFWAATLREHRKNYENDKYRCLDLAFSFWTVSKSQEIRSLVMISGSLDVYLKPGKDTQCGHKTVVFDPLKSCEVDLCLYVVGIDRIQPSQNPH